MSTKKKIFNILLATWLVLFSILGYLTSSIISAQPAKAADASLWDAGRIIDDGKFTDSNSMSVADIQNFLNSKVPTCDTWHPSGMAGESPPWTCLKDFSENGKPAAQIIWEEAQNYTINPQVLLVTLQKETGLVTDTWPYSWQYRTAMGFACPDNGTCDPAFYGFTNQVHQAARHFRNFYDDNPNWYVPYTTGVHYIQYNPNSGCGGSNVNIQTRGTAALYSYTPYQPNAAALANLYGTGDGCSAYGNRNFWRTFTDWFGTTYDAVHSWRLSYQGWDKDIFHLPQGEKATLTIKALNTGIGTWSNSGPYPVRLGTSNPDGRGSAFATSTWPVWSNRAATLQEPTVAPGQVGTFIFQIQASVPPGTYNEYFNLVAENVTWFPSVGQYFPITVVQPNIVGTVTQNTYPASMSAGSTSTDTIKMRNDGNVTWYNDGSYPAELYTYSNARPSSFATPVWISAAKPTKLTETAVAPGQIGTFTFPLQAPGVNNTYQEQFIAGLTNLGWIGNTIFTQSIQVSSGQAQTKIPVYRHYSPSHNAHFYTTDLNESQIIRTQGWNYEGISWYAPATPTSVPVYRHYNPSIGKHFFTTDPVESQQIRTQGWNYEGIAFYADPSQTSVPIYRHWNQATGDHFYTSDLVESQSIRNNGWTYEGISWYAEP